MTAGTERLGAQPRSLLFVPAGDPRKLGKAIVSPADVLLIDLEDSVAPNAKAAARQIAAEFIAEHIKSTDRPRLYVRVNDLASGLIGDDLAAILPAKPDGIMLPKANSGADVAALAGLMEGIAGAETERMGIIAIATETPAAVLQMPSFIGANSRLEGMTWGSEDLGTAIGVTSARDEAGNLTSPFLLARNLCLFAAYAAEVQAIDSIFADFRNEAGLAREAAEAARDGFTGKMAIHPAQVPVINAAFTPSAEAIAEARAIISAFAANPGAGTIGLDGRMIDRPHLLRARRLLARVPQEGQVTPG